MRIVADFYPNMVKNRCVWIFFSPPQARHSLFSPPKRMIGSSSNWSVQLVGGGGGKGKMDVHRQRE